MNTMLHRYQLLKKAIPPIFIIWTMAMLFLTLLPSETIPDVSLFSYDKIGHFGMFGGWTFFLGLYMVVYKEHVEVNLVILALAGILFGGLIEALQYLLPGDRIASWGDIVANSLGCITGSLVLHPVKKFLNSKK